MNRKMLGFLSIASIFGSDASHYNESDSARPVSESELKRRLRLIEENYQPSGTNLYCFNAEGSMRKGAMLKSECVFKCYARNEKNARRKYANYLNVSQNQ